MLKAGNIKDHSQAKTFGNYLVAQGIDNQVDPGLDDDWEVWIITHDHLEDARDLLIEYLQDPDNAKYLNAGREADARVEDKEDRQKAYERQHRRGRDLFRAVHFQLKSLTGLLIIVSIMFTLLSLFGQRMSFLQPLLITEYTSDGTHIRWLPGLVEVRAGQWWRLITPIFLHFSFIHLFFNMWWTKDLGYMVERKRSWWYLLLMVLAIAVPSNIAQFLASSPNFGGMSGVVFGLFGYCWFRGKFDPDSDITVSRRNTIMMLIWFFVCMSGLVGHIANMAHGVGLGVGMAWGGIEAVISRLRRTSP